MAGNENTLGAPNRNGWRIARWGAAAALLCVPAIAMQFGDEVNWGPEDFIFMGGMLALALGAYELLSIKAANAAYRVASALAVLGIFLLIWISLAVGIIGDDGNDSDVMYLAVLAIGIGGSAIARLRAAGMAYTVFAMAGAQILIAAIAVAAQLGAEGPIWPRDVLGVTAILSGIWFLSGALFRHSER